MATEARKTQLINGLLHGNIDKHTGWETTGNIITVSFSTPTYPSDIDDPLGSVAQNAFRAACALWEQVANIHFSFETDPAKAILLSAMATQATTVVRRTLLATISLKQAPRLAI